MSSYSGLNDKQRAEARRIIAEGASLLLAHPDRVHYTQGPARWAINRRLSLKHPDQWLPFEGDCSSTASFLLWLALHERFHLPDLVNGESWQAGYTGTIAQHGKRVHYDASIKVGDLILYGPAPTYSHVTVALGGGWCFSHGSEAGPFKLPITYRSDRGPTKRFI